MELFKPEIGLIIWMLIPFLVVFGLLAKFAWPSIIRGVEERGKFIDDSLQSAKEANERLAGIKEEGEQILAAARSEQMQILKEAAAMRESLIEEARKQARSEGDKLLRKAQEDIAKEREEAIRQIRREVALLSVDIAEKVIRKHLDDKDKQIDVVNRLLDEINISKS